MLDGESCVAVGTNRFWLAGEEIGMGKMRVADSESCEYDLFASF